MTEPRRTIAERLADARSKITSQHQAGLTLGDCMDLHAALSYLGADRQIERDGKTITERYRLGQKVRYAIARTLKALEDHVQLVGDVRKQVIADYPQVDGEHGRQIAPDHVAAFEAEMHDLLATPADPKPVLHRCRLDELKVGDGEDLNPIPANILADLDTWLIYDREAALQEAMAATPTSEAVEA